METIALLRMSATGAPSWYVRLNLKYGEHCIDDFQSIYIILYTI